jgi:hypothetical protein
MGGVTTRYFKASRHAGLSPARKAHERDHHAPKTYTAVCSRNRGHATTRVIEHPRGQFHGVSETKQLAALRHLQHDVQIPAKPARRRKEMSGLPIALPRKVTPAIRAAPRGHCKIIGVILGVTQFSHSP